MEAKAINFVFAPLSMSEECITFAVNWILELPSQFHDLKTTHSIAAVKQARRRLWIICNPMTPDSYQLFNSAH